MLSIKEVRSVVPVVVKYERDGTSTEDVFHIDYFSGELRYADTGTPVEDEELRQALFEYVAERTPPLKVPPLPPREEL